MNPSLSTQVPRVLIEAFWFSHDAVLAGNSADVLPAPVNVTFFLFFLTPFSNVEVVKNLFPRDLYIFSSNSSFFLYSIRISVLTSPCDTSLVKSKYQIPLLK